MDLRSLALTIGVILAIFLSLGAVWYLDRPQGAWTRRLRARLLFGVPWGTLVSIALVVFVYLFLQRGWWAPYSPLTLPFTSWSYLYPLGWLTAPFSHGSFSHITGNLVGTLALAPLAEYAWSHFPTRRGSTSFSSWRTNPYLRSFVLFPLGIIVVGLGTSLFAWGPIIGFSGVVFAFAGFALVRYPLATVVALSARGVINTIYYTLRDPVVVGSASPSYGPPWWVGIAVQGHLLGFLLGAVVAAVLFSQRERAEQPSALRVWTGTLLVGISLTLWALWWYRGPETYVLYRGVGVVLVLALGVALALVVRARAKPLIANYDLGLTRQQAAIALLVVPLLTMAFVAVPINLVTVSAGDPVGEGVTVRDYTVTYAEEVPNRRVGAIDVELFNETTQVNTSGVIVSNPDRHLWTRQISTGSLAYWGDQTVKVGGVGWEETVHVKRHGWNAVGGSTAYVVQMRVDGPWEHVFTSSSATAAPQISNRTISVVPGTDQFSLRVTRGNQTLGRGTIPAKNETVTAGGLTFVRNETRVVAVHDGTRVTVVTKETYK